MDVESRAFFRTSPVNVGAERDFNRVDIEGHPVDAVEHALASFEGEVATALGTVIRSEEYPSDEDLNLILNLLGVIAIRNPRARGSHNRFRATVLRRINELLVSDRRIFDSYVERARESGHEISDSVSFESIKRFVDDGNYRFEFHPQENLRVEFNALDSILPLLGQRTWSLLVAPPRGPEFVCSDHPVTLRRKGDRSGPIGLGTLETEVFFPIGRRVGFYGVFEAPWDQVIRCEPELVAEMNRRVFFNTNRQVYSALERFYVWDEGRIREVLCVEQTQE